tara:strand:- start:362 stop:1276 length:915 start_codon:yes stop_codon:yes gene_type:complete
MNIVFFSNGFFGIESLRKINKSKYNLVGVVTNAAKPSGRGLINKNTPIYNWSIKNNLNTITVSDLDNKSFINELELLQADLFIVIEYKILPPKIFNIPKYGTINMHASILPKYRGSAPIQRALMNGDETLGLTIFKIDSNIDTGNIINSKKVLFNDKTTYEEAYYSLSNHGALFLLKSISNLKDDTTFIKQNHKLFSTAPKINNSDKKINFNKNAFNVHNQIRALHSKPGSYCNLENKRVKLFDTYYNINNNLKVGEFTINDNKLYIGCKEGQLEVKAIQIEGKAKITAQDFSNNQKYKNSIFE